MSETTLTSKGQVTVPKDIRERMGLASGDKLAFTMLSDGTVVMRAKTQQLQDRPCVHRQHLCAVAGKPGHCVRTRGTVEEALYIWAQHPLADFADCLIRAHAGQLGCRRFVTFDAGAAKLPGAELLQ